MTIKISYALVAALAMIAGPALAQDAAPTPPAATQPGTPENPAPAAAPATEAPADAAAAPAAEPESDGAASDAPADAPATTADATAQGGAGPAPANATRAESEVGQYYLRESHGDWSVRCLKAREGAVDPCELYQLMRDGEGNPVAEITMIPLLSGDAAAGATLIAPLETDLLRGLGFGVDNGEQRGYPFAVCNQIGCVSRIGFTADELAALKRGRQAKVTLLPYGADPQRPIDLSLSLTGFTAAFDSLSATAREAQQNAAAAESGNGAKAPAPAPRDGDAPAPAQE